MTMVATITGLLASDREDTSLSELAGLYEGPDITGLKGGQEMPVQ